VARGREATAPVVAGPRRDDDRPAPELAPQLVADDLGQVASRLLHHLEEGDAELLDGEAVDLGHGGGVDAGHPGRRPRLDGFDHDLPSITPVGRTAAIGVA
jgi:hypothetical protein